jgi:hypothetical protein
MDNSIFYYSGSAWVQLPGNGRGYRIAAGSGGIFVIGTTNAIYQHPPL